MHIDRPSDTPRDCDPFTVRTPNKGVSVPCTTMDSDKHQRTCQEISTNVTQIISHIYRVNEYSGSSTSLSTYNRSFLRPISGYQASTAVYYVASIRFTTSTQYKFLLARVCSDDRSLNSWKYIRTIYRQYSNCNLHDFNSYPTCKRCSLALLVKRSSQTACCTSMHREDVVVNLLL